MRFEQSDWYKIACAAIASVLETKSGAVAMTREEWRETLKDENADLKECPNAVFEHISLGLKARGMRCCGLRDLPIEQDHTTVQVPDGRVVVIWREADYATREEARAKCERDGLSVGAQEQYEEFEELQVANA